MKTRWIVVWLILVLVIAVIAGLLINKISVNKSYSNSPRSSNEERALGNQVGLSPESDLCSDESQIILKLSAETNAHGEKPGVNPDDGYDVAVCYDEIFGRLGSGVRICNGNNKIVGLSADTNAHFEIPGLSNYATEVCYEGLSCISVDSGDECPQYYKSVLRLSDDTNAHGQINTESGYNFNICCSTAEAPPTAFISKPEHLQIYFVDTDIEFQGNPLGFDEDVSYSWTIFNSTGIEFTETQQSFIHRFTETRQRIIRLRITGDESGTWAEDQISILIVGSERLLADINAPMRFEIVPNPDNGNRIRYNTSESYVVNTTLTNQVTGSPPCYVEMECLAGNCPAYPMNVPANRGLPGEDGCINPDPQIPIANSPQSTGGPADYSELRFGYSFDDGDSFTLDDKPSGIKVYPSGQQSDDLNDKWIKLTLEHIGGQSFPETVRNEFTLGYCLDDGNIIIDPNTGQQFPTTGGNISGSPPGACALAGLPGCCPAGTACVGDPGEEQCVITDISMCADYTTSPIPGGYNRTYACDNDIANIIELDPLYELYGCGRTENGTVIQCECQWDGPEPGGECEFVVNIINNTGGGGQDPCTISSCSYTYELGECIDGFARITHSGSGPGESIDPSCGGAGLCNELELPERVPCGRLNFQLGFFDFKQFIAVFIITFLAYLLVYLERNKR